METSHVYIEDGVLPSAGELIKIRYPMAACGFEHGPRSRGSLGTQPACAASANKLPFHYVLVSNTVVTTEGNIAIRFFPIVSYSSPPTSFGGDNWDAEKWMKEQDEETNLHHLPMPAVNWNSPLPSLWGPESLGFGSWKNSRVSWLTIVKRIWTIPAAETWKRFSPPVLISLDSLERISRFKEEVDLRLMETRSIVANHVSLQNHENIWVDIFARNSECYANTNSDDGSYSDSDVDPINFWRYPGAPNAMAEMVKRFDKEQANKNRSKILNWSLEIPGAEGDGKYVEGGGYSEDNGGYVKGYDEFAEGGGGHVEGDGGYDRGDGRG